MVRLARFSRQGGLALLLSGTLVGFLLVPGASRGRQDRTKFLRIGTSGSLSGNNSASKETAALKTLKAFIKEETGMNNDVFAQKSWRELADKMSKGKLELGVFQGDEFAWASEKYSALEPLALAVNVDRYPTAYVVTKRTNKARDFSGLAGQSLGMSSSAPHFLRTFLRKESGKKPEDFFSKIKSQ